MRRPAAWIPFALVLGGCSTGTVLNPPRDGAVTHPSTDATITGEDGTVTEPEPGADATVEPDDATVTVSPDGFAFDDAPPAADVPRLPLPPLVNLFASDAPADAPDHFSDSPVSTGGGTIEYPEPGTIVPRNLPSFEVHFTPGHGHDLFAVQFRGGSSAIRIFTRCTGTQSVGGGCIVHLNDTQMATVAQAADDTGEVEISVLEVSSSGGTPSESPAQTLGIPLVGIQGGMYYWDASGSILRYEFGLPSAHPETFIAGNPIGCAGCHILARNGERAAVGFGIPGLAMSTYDVSSRTTLGGSHGASFGTFSPDASQLLLASWNTMTLMDAATGTTLSALPGNTTTGTMPDWSPDGRRVVFVRGQTVGPTGVDGTSDLYFMTTQSAGGFSSAVPLLRSSGECNYYPSYSPDGDWVVFNRSSQTSYAAPDARVFVMPKNGGVPTELAAANTTYAAANSWPKWAPFVQTYQGEPLMWVTFSSVRDYGLRSRPVVSGSDGGADAPTAQLWMAAFRPARVGSSEPSAPAYWMPFQNLASSNHIAQWVETVQRHACMADTDCQANEHCLTLASRGRCVMN